MPRPLRSNPRDTTWRTTESAFRAQRRNQQEARMLSLDQQQLDRQRVKFRYLSGKEKRYIESGIPKLLETSGYSSQGKQPIGPRDRSHQKSPYFAAGARSKVDEKRLLRWRVSERHLQRVLSEDEQKIPPWERNKRRQEAQRIMNQLIWIMEHSGPDVVSSSQSRGESDDAVTEQDVRIPEEADDAEGKPSELTTTPDKTNTVFERLHDRIAIHQNRTVTDVFANLKLNEKHTYNFTSPQENKLHDEIAASNHPIANHGDASHFSVSAWQKQFIQDYIHKVATPGSARPPRDEYQRCYLQAGPNHYGREKRLHFRLDSTHSDTISPGEMKQRGFYTSDTSKRETGNVRPITATIRTNGGNRMAQTRVKRTMSAPQIVTDCTNLCTEINPKKKQIPSLNLNVLVHDDDVNSETRRAESEKTASEENFAIRKVCLVNNTGKLELKNDLEIPESCQTEDKLYPETEDGEDNALHRRNGSLGFVEPKQPGEHAVKQSKKTRRKSVSKRNKTEKQKTKKPKVVTKIRELKELYEDEMTDSEEEFETESAEKRIAQWRRDLMKEAPPGIYSVNSPIKVQLAIPKSQLKRDLDRLVVQHALDQTQLVNNEHARRLATRFEVYMTMKVVEQAVRESYTHKHPTSSSGLSDTVQTPHSN